MVAVVFAMVITLAGCQSLGFASPFSSGADDYNRAQREWGSRNEAAALYYAATAINRDDSHWGAYGLIFEIYDDAISKSTRTA